MKRFRLLAAVPVAAATLIMLASPALATSPQVGIADIEDEVMCPICGTLLELANSPQAERQRAFIKKLIREGETKEEIKDALVVQYGKEALALPEGSGFSLSAYLIPVIAFLVAAVALAVGVLRWRRDTDRSGAESPTPPPTGVDAERLEADLSHYDL